MHLTSEYYIDYNFMPRKQTGNKDGSVRLVLGVVLLLVGLGGFGMMLMMGAFYFWRGMFGFYGYLVSVLLAVLGVYLIYDGLR